MTALRQRMIEDLQLRGLSTMTQTCYVRAVRQLAEHYGKPPDQISEEEVRQYFLYLKTVKHVAPNTFGVDLAGIKFFYEHTLKRGWPTLEMVRPSRERKLPVVLSIARGTPTPGVYPSATLSGLPEHNLCLWVALERGDSPSGSRHRQQADGGAHTAREGSQGSLCSPASTHPGDVAPVLDHPSASRVAFS